MSQAELHGFRRVVRAIQPFLIGLIVSLTTSILSHYSIALVLRLGLGNAIMTFSIIMFIALLVLSRIGERNSRCNVIWVGGSRYGLLPSNPLNQ